MEAAAVLGIVSATVTLFDGCVKGFVLLSAAAEIGSKGDVLRCQLEWEHFRLNNWATTAGLFQVPPELNVSYPHIVQGTLSNLERLLGDAEKIKEEYGLTLTISEEEFQDVNTERRLFGRTLGKVKPQFVNDTTKVYSRRNNVWKKVRWAATDAAGLRLLLKDIRYFNKRLESLLHPVDRNRYDTDSNAVMRSIVTRVSDKNLLDILSGTLDPVDSAIAASARLKQKGYLLELLEPYHSSSSGTATPTGHGKSASVVLKSTHRRQSPGDSLKASDLQRDAKQLVLKTGSRFSSREVGSYADAPVIIEWKRIDRTRESRLKHRVANVAAFLAEMDDPAFHSLTCSGYLKEPQSGHYAYLFKPPPTADAKNGRLSAKFSMKSLGELFVLQSLRPSLNQRVSIAISLAETVLQLHTAGWLHKSIRPDNILFFNASIEDWTASDELPAAYLGGYEYARASNRLETTEDPSSSQYCDLYRHPVSLCSGRPSYHQLFDMYSLGCILIELAIWAPLETILLQCVRSEGAQSQSGDLTSISAGPDEEAEYYHRASSTLLSEQGSDYDRLERELGFKMGHEYAAVVRKCFSAGTTLNGELDEYSEDSVELQQDTLARLRRLFNVL
jgi:Prion-inhibition and propagation